MSVPSNPTPDSGAGGSENRGAYAFDFGEVEGTVHSVADTKDVVRILKDPDADDTIALIHDCGATFLTPILPKLRGVVCTTGNPGTHLGIVAREYQLPCLFVLGGDTLADGTVVRLVTNGADGAVEIVKPA